MDPVYAKRIGVDVDELLVSQPDHGEQALEIADLLIRSGAVDVVAIDSVAALTPKVELEGAMGDQTVGLQARMMSPGDAQAGRQPEPRQHALHLHEPDPREDRRDVRLARDAAGRPGAQVLRVAAARHPPHRDPQGGHRGGRQPGAREGRQEQGRRAVPPGRVRHRVRPGHQLGGLHPRPRDRARHRAEVRLVLLLRGRPSRPGPQQRQGLPAREPGDGPGDRAQDLRGAGGGSGRVAEQRWSRRCGVRRPGRRGRRARPRPGPQEQAAMAEDQAARAP